MEKVRFPEDLKEQYRYAIEKSREDRPRYFNWIKDEIQKLINLINSYDKVFLLGALGSKLIKATPTFYNQFLETYEGPDKKNVDKEELLQNDDQIEILLEYAMSLATAESNNNKSVPTSENIEEVYAQLSKIKSNISFWELSAEIPPDGNEFDHWLRTHMVQNTIHVRGDGCHLHIHEVFKEIFEPHNGFLDQYYGFNANDLYDTIIKLDSLVYSKVGNPFGSTQSHKRLTDWMKNVGEEQIKNTMRTTGKHFIRQFTEANPDLFDESAPDSVMAHHLDNILGYNKIFWVIPQSDKERKIFNCLATTFGSNTIFFEPEKFKGFPLNDTIIKLRPLIKENEKYFHFSLHLAFRNIFQIAENLINSADAVYYENSFRGNSNKSSKDNYIELKTKSLFQKLLPSSTFYHSLEYTIIEDGITKKTELDILGLSEDSAFIIEVKAGELNQKHRRGAMKGLKDRLKETINEGSYQCHRGLKYIRDNPNPSFEYIANGKRNLLEIDKQKIKSFYKISVTFEHFSSISANLKYLIKSGVLSEDYKWTWIISLYDLMIFADLIESESDFKYYLENRIALYDRQDIEISDEIDILGFYFENKFPLGKESPDEVVHIINFKDDIERYYTRSGVGMPKVNKPKRKKG